MRRLLILLLFLCWNANAAFTEFYVQTTGNNLNSGHTPDDAATFTATGGFFTNNTSASVCTYFKSGLNPDAGGVTNGAWASIYPDATATNAVYVGLITAHDDTADTITVSLTAKSGTVPASDTSGAGATSIKVGGSWSGPNTNFSLSVPHPFHFVQATMTNTSGNVPCINFKAGTYSTTNGMTAGNAGPIVWSGYTNAPRDGGRATIDGTWGGPLFAVLTVSAVNQTLKSFIFNKNGTGAASSYGVVCSAGETVLENITVRGMVRGGISTSGGQFISCEVYGCNTANVVSIYGWSDSSAAYLFNCLVYSNTTANTSGFRLSGNAVAVNTISYANGLNGFLIDSTTSPSLINCDTYFNGGSGVDFTSVSGTSVLVRNCSFVRNGAYGINSSGSAIRNGLIQNCAFGSGTMTNTSGNFGPNITGASGGIVESKTIILPANSTPWENPDVGNFAITSTAVKSMGNGAFTHSFTNFSGFPDIGAAQSASTNSSSAGGAYTWAQ